MILPPVEKAEAEPDRNSDILYDENEGLAHHLPVRLLTPLCSTNTVKQNLNGSDQTVDDESHKQPSKRHKQNKKERKWKKVSIHSAHNIIVDPNESPAELPNFRKTTFDAFWNIDSDDLLDIITTQTNIYAQQHKWLNPSATSEEMKIVISILLMSGYCRIPQRELYRSTSPDIQNKSVSKDTSRNRF